MQLYIWNIFLIPHLGAQSFHSSFIHNPLFFFYFDVFEHVSEKVVGYVFFSKVAFIAICQRQIKYFLFFSGQTVHRFFGKHSVVSYVYFNSPMWSEHHDRGWSHRYSPTLQNRSLDCPRHYGLLPAGGQHPSG